MSYFYIFYYLRWSTLAMIEPLKEPYSNKISARKNGIMNHKHDLKEHNNILSKLNNDHTGTYLALFGRAHFYAFN